MNDKMSTARGRLALYAGFWLALAAKLQWIPDVKAPGGVAATDSKRVWYNPENLNERPLGEVVYIALHEIGHNMLCHLTRGAAHPNWNHEVKGIAMDIALNELLDKVAKETPHLGMVPPDDACRGEAFGGGFEGMSWEAIYLKLMKNAKKCAGKGGFDEHLDPKNDDGTAMSQAELDSLGKEWQVATQAAAEMAKQMGKLPGFLEEFIGELIKPKVDWRTQLANCMSKVASDESSYRRFNRRHIARGSYLPGYYSERIGPIGYFCDTSGSISSQEFAAGKGAMTDILEDLKPERIYFGQCDTQLHRVDELLVDDLPLPELTVVGRGGTDMREAMEWACQHEQEIDAFILQTDGYVPPLDPELVPNVPVIILLTTDAVMPSGWDFGNHIRIEL
jgi:predicted metal-dependent peptidase